MILDKKLNQLPLIKNNPVLQNEIFGKSDLDTFWVADMEFEISENIQKALIDRISNSSFGYEYYPDSFIKNRNDWYKKRYNLDLSLRNVLHSPSITTSLTLILQTFTSEGDGIIIQPPVFTEFKKIIRNNNRIVVTNSLKNGDSGYEIDFEDLESKAKNESSKILILCNPHNPVGRVWLYEEISEIVKIAKKYNLMIISDEIHKDILLFNNNFYSLLRFDEYYENILVVTSEAKSFNLCSISDSLIITSNTIIAKKIRKELQKFNLGTTNALTRVALESAYKFGEAWLNDVISTIEQNIIGIENKLVNSLIKLNRPEGTYQIWLDLRELFNDSKLMISKIVQELNLAVNAGHWFGKEGAGFVRVNIGTSYEKVMKSITKLIELESKLKK